MYLRCNNSKHPRYNDWGKRGIKVLWKSFEEFMEDMYMSYFKHCEDFGKKNTTIERIDNDGNYCKENCRWATPKEQANNRRPKLKSLLSFQGETKTITEWAKELNTCGQTIYKRLYTYNWSIEKTLTTHVRFRRTNNRD